MFKTIFAAVSAAILSFGVTGAASAVTIDFNSISPGTEITGTDLGGVTLSAAGTTLSVSSSNPAPGEGNTIGTGDFRTQIRADFTNATDLVSIDLGDFGADLDNLFLQAYDMSGTLLASASATLGSGVTDMITLSVSTLSANISYALFGSTGSFNNSVYADNLTFNEMAPIPLPAGLPLLLGAIGLMGVAARRRRAAA